MKSNEKLENENTKKIHYLIIGEKFSKTRDKINKNLKFYRLSFSNKFNGLEIIYDIPSRLLSNAGLILSKQYDDNKIFFKVRKISKLPGGYRRPSQKFVLGESEEGEAPKDFAMQIAHAISNLYANVFTIDIVSVVRQTEPIYEISVNGNSYEIIGGTGYRAELLDEIATYKDIETNKKVKRHGITLIMPNDEKYEKENQTIIQTIEHYCKELVGYEQSRFEIAQRLLHPETIEKPKEEKNDDEDSEDAK